MKPVIRIESDITLRTLREAVSITQEELAASLGTSKQLVSLWERRVKIPRLDNAVALARRLNVSMKDLCLALGIDVSNIPDDLPPR